MIPHHAWVVILRDDGTQSFIRASENGEVRTGKKRALGSQLVGHPFGSSFEFRDEDTVGTSVSKQKALEDLNSKRAKKSKGSAPHLVYSNLVRVERREEAQMAIDKESDGEDDGEEDTKDNRSYQSNPANQKADTQELIKSGLSGEEIIKALTMNSVTFDLKNKFSKQKFLNRITHKYLPRVTVLRTTGRTIAECLFLKHEAGGMSSDPIRSCRWVDTLPQMLAFGNIHASSKAMVLDGIGGLLSLCVLERLQENSGKCIFVCTTPREMEGGGGRAYIELLNLPRSKMTSTFVLMPSYCFQRDGSVLAPTKHSHVAPVQEEEDTGMSSKRVKVVVSEEEIQAREEDVKKREGIRESMSSLLNTKEGGSGADSLLIAAKQNPSEALKVLFPHLGLGKPFVIHSPTLEPLMECRAMIANQRGSVLDLVVTETFCREYQNLEQRIHPMMTGSASGGFLLRGIKVQEWTY